MRGRRVSFFLSSWTESRILGRSEGSATDPPAKTAPGWQPVEKNSAPSNKYRLIRNSKRDILLWSMLQFQKNKLFYFATLLLLICLSAAAGHFLVHAAHDGDSASADHCALCRFVSIIGLVLFCIFIFFLKLERAQFNFSEPKHFLPFRYLSAISGRAPPFILS